jgi:hypothetical protein
MNETEDSHMAPEYLYQQGKATKLRDIKQHPAMQWHLVDRGVTFKALAMFIQFLDTNGGYISFGRGISFEDFYAIFRSTERADLAAAELIKMGIYVASSDGKRLEPFREQEPKAKRSPRSFYLFDKTFQTIKHESEELCITMSAFVEAAIAAYVAEKAKGKTL